MRLLGKVFGRSTADKVAWIEVDELSTLLDTASPPLVIDVRGPDEFSGPLGHIDAAENIPLDQIPAHAAALLGDPRPIVFVCHTDRRSAAAADHLRRAGRSQIAVLRGGMVAWQSRGEP